MFLRVKRVNGHDYLVLVENFRDQGRHRQRVLRWFGRSDRLDLIEVRRVLSTMPTLGFLSPDDEP